MYGSFLVVLEGKGKEATDQTPCLVASGGVQSKRNAGGGVSLGIRASARQLDFESRVSAPRQTEAIDYELISREGGLLCDPPWTGKLAAYAVLIKHPLLVPFAVEGRAELPDPFRIYGWI